MKYSTFILLAVQLATYVNGKPLPVEEENKVEVRELEFHELQSFFKRAAETATADVDLTTATAAADIPSSENPFATGDLSTEPPAEDLFGRDDSNSFVQSSVAVATGTAPAVATPIPTAEDPFQTAELTTEPPPSDLFGRSVEFVKHPRALRKRATGNSDKTFDLSQVENPNKQALDGQTAYIKAYGKYSKNLPPSLQDASKSNNKLKEKLVKQTGSVAATAPKDYESEFVIPVQIGTPAQTIYLDLDTGSADLWTFSSDTPKNKASGHTLYSPGNSSTAKKLANQNWKISYADGSGASGIVYTDKVQIGNTFVQTQAVESATKVSSDFVGDTFSSGILGMAFSGGNTVRPTRQKTYIENIQNSLSSPIFTANLQKEKPGTYQFGYIDDTAFTGSIQYTPVTKGSVFWQFTSSGYQVGTGTFKKTSIPAIVDTGTTLLLVPSSIVKAYYSGVKGAYFDPYEGMYTFPCSASLPNFTFGVGSYRGVVPGSYINYGNAGLKRCYGGIQSSDGLDVAIFGDILLKAQYVVFDYGKKQLGFANKNTT